MSQFTDNAAKFGLKDFPVRLRLTFSSPSVTVYRRVNPDGTVTNVPNGEDPTEDDFPVNVSIYAGDVKTDEPRSLVETLCDLPSVQAFTSKANPQVVIFLEAGKQFAWEVQVINAATNKVVGTLSPYDGDFHYTEAPTLREFIAWAWCSGIGRNQELDVALLDKATRSIAHFAAQWDTEHMPSFSSWANECGQWFQRDITSRYGPESYFNPTWKVANRVVHGVVKPGFSFAY